MSNIVFVKKYLKVNKLEEGTVYLHVDGRVLLYLGRNDSQRYVFYTFGSFAYVNLRDKGLAVGGRGYQEKYMINLCNQLMSEDLMPELLYTTDSMPELYTTFNLVDYRDTYLEWYNKYLKLSDKKEGYYEALFLPEPLPGVSKVLIE